MEGKGVPQNERPCSFCLEFHIIPSAPFIFASGWSAMRGCCVRGHYREEQTVHHTPLAGPSGDLRSFVAAAFLDLGPALAMLEVCWSCWR